LSMDAILASRYPCRDVIVEQMITPSGPAQKTISCGRHPPINAASGKSQQLSQSDVRAV
jgi:hypothetical protein